MKILDVTPVSYDKVNIQIGHYDCNYFRYSNGSWVIRIDGEDWVIVDFLAKDFEELYQRYKRETTNRN